MKTEEGSGFRRMAIVGVSLPHVVSLCLALAFKSIVGHAGYTATPNELQAFDRMILGSTWAAIAASVPLSLPYALRLMKSRRSRSGGSRQSLAKKAGLVLAYAGVIIANGLAVLLFAGVVSMLAGGPN